MFICHFQKERMHSLLSQSLELAKKNISSGERSVSIILSEMSVLFSKIQSANLDYIKIVEAGTFEFVDELTEGKEYFVLVACKIGSTRLIDNMLITA